MYQLSALMAWFYNWCRACAEAMPRWKGFAIVVLAWLGFVLSIFFAPGWFTILYWLIVLGPTQVFGRAHYHVWKEHDE